MEDFLVNPKFAASVADLRGHVLEEVEVVPTPFLMSDGGDAERSSADRAKCFVLFRLRGHCLSP